MSNTTRLFPIASALDTDIYVGALQQHNVVVSFRKRELPTVTKPEERDDNDDDLVASSSSSPSSSQQKTIEKKEVPGAKSGGKMPKWLMKGKQ